MDKWLSQLMDNKKGINNKNVKQLLENDYLLIHCLTRWIGNCRCPLWQEENVLRLLPNSDKNDSSYSSTHFNCYSHKIYENNNIFLEKYKLM